MAFFRGDEVPKELRFLKRVFADHYRKGSVDAPYRFARREWGFFPFGGKMMFRHISFNRKSELDGFFLDTVPMHAYYSVAYYGAPSLQPMGDKFKTWMGADLIFDLDSDHLPDAESMSYTEQLEQVKEEVKRLLFEFILDDLGLPEEYTRLYFSGGRGYHVHVRDPDVLPLDSRARRNIVDYITGRGLDLDKLFPKITVSVNTKYGSHKEKRKFPKDQKGGWISKIYTGRDRLISDLAARDKKGKIDLLLWLGKKGKIKLGKDMCRSILGHEKNFHRIVGTSRFDIFERNQQLEMFLQLVVAYSSIHLSGETDEPVTTDIKRLIRCPGSLHGKTGFKVVEVPIDRVDDFDPLRDAVVLPDDPVKVNVVRPVEQYLGSEDHSLQPGEHTVPTYLAYFLVARRLALLPGSDPDQR
ncbi:MAG: DNA primase catalytic subunit PriS [Candidatus Thermoplasmatota archaeon]|nr:DNA primase catalytic subunit PriS [Candidatus Thermoplasmatota archaeon]